MKHTKHQNATVLQPAVAFAIREQLYEVIHSFDQLVYHVRALFYIYVAHLPSFKYIFIFRLQFKVWFQQEKAD